MRRAIYLAAFAVLAVAAGLLTLRSQHTVGVLVATHDLSAGVAVQSGDVEVKRVHDDSLPGGALSSSEQAIGQYATMPLTGGEPILGRQLRTQRSGGSVASGLAVPAGYRAVAVPVQPAGAVGGMLAHGDHVDVFATPLQGRSAGVALTSPSNASTSNDGASSPLATQGQATRLGHEVLVIELRSDQGQSLGSGTGTSVHGLDFGNGKLGSVVLAVPEADVPSYAAAVAVDNIYLALSVG